MKQTRRRYRYDHPWRDGQMKARAAQTTHAALAALSILLATGCSDRQPSSNQPTQTLNANQGLKELEAKVGISFPTNAMLVNSGDGGGRDASYGFYEWTVFSPAPIKMPFLQAKGVKDYLNLPLADTVEFIESKMRTRKVTQPQSAFGSEWQTNAYEFRRTIVRSAQGDYLVIEQFRKK